MDTGGAWTDREVPGPALLASPDPTRARRPASWSVDGQGRGWRRAGGHALARRLQGRSLALLLLAAASLAAGCASRGAGQATEAALEKLREPPPPGSERVGVRIGGDMSEGILGELASPEGLASVTAIVDAAVVRSLTAALERPAVAGRRGSGGEPARSLVGRVGLESGAGFADALARQLEAALGPDGQGPLARSLGATAAQISSSVARGVRDELGDSLLPGCALGDRACVEAEVRSLGRAASEGFMEGLLATAALPALALAFVLGAVMALLVRGVLGRSRPLRSPEHREAHP